MSQAFHQGIFGFSDGFDRQHQPEQQQEEATNIYVPDGNVWSEMFNFTSSGISATDLLANQMSAGYRLHRSPAAAAAPGFGGDSWYGGTAHRDDNSTPLQVTSSGGGLCLGGLIEKKQNHQHALPGQLNAGGSAAACMQLFLMDPQHQVQQPRSPSAPPPVPQAIPLHHDFAAPVPSFAGGGGGGEGGVVGQGLSLSLFSPLQQLEAAKAEELRDGLLQYNGHDPMQLPGQHQYQPLHVVGSMAMMNALRHSKYARPAQELLEELCNVGGGRTKGGGKRGKAHLTSSNPNLITPTHGGEGGCGGASSSCSAKEPPPLLSPSERVVEQRRKAKLLSILDELERRYIHYREQMQMAVNCFDSAMGHGAAAPYTGLARKAISRHFRCLKDAITAQLKRTCMLLGEKDGGVGSGITKGETPRLRILEQSLRQQRSSSFHHMGIMMDQEPWRPQRGLPERSVNTLRAWLFEHFLHPYPSDGDKHRLARQTGLTRNQVSNWFINARVRLWKPMIEEMYLQEAKPEEEREKGAGGQTSSQAQARHPETTTPAAETKSSRPITSLSPSVPKQEQRRQQPPFPSPSSSSDANPLNNVGGGGLTMSGRYRAGVRFAAAPGDVTLTLGLRHAGNMADNSGGFSLGADFAGR